MVSDFKWGVLAAIIIHVLKRVAIPVFFPFYFRVINPKFEGELRVEWAKKGALNLFKTFYYVIAFIIGFYFLTPLEACPEIMFGKGDLSLMFKDFPTWNKPWFFDIYYAASIGYHLEGLVLHFQNHKNADYIEMWLHHCVTCTLIFASHLANAQVIGALILWIHHWADIFCAGARACMDIKSPIVLFFVAGINIVWPYSWLYCFYHLIKTAVNAWFDTLSFKYEEIQIYHYLFDFNLMALYVLHIYWETRFL